MYHQVPLDATGRMGVGAGRHVLSSPNPSPGSHTPGIIELPEIFKEDLEKAEEQEVKLPIFVGS